jgi:aminopeptidase 2
MSSVFYQDDDIARGLKKLSGDIFAPNAKTLGWDYPELEKADHLKNLKRTLCLRECAKADDADTVKECQARFERHVKGDANAIHPNLRTTIFSTVLRNSDKEKAKQVLDVIVDGYKKAETADQKNALLLSMGASPHLADKTLSIALDETVVKPQDIMYPIASLTRENPDAKNVRPQVWQWVQDNFDRLHERLAASLTLLGRVVQFSIEGIVDPAVSEQVKAWTEGSGLSDEEKKKREGQVKGINMMVKQSLETMGANNQWVARDGKVVHDWFAKRA